MQSLRVLADANVLVKDVVSFVFYDLAVSGLIDLRWTPQIEAEYAKHRARLRAQARQRDLDPSDLIWAVNRLKPIKQHLVPNYLPDGWCADGDRLEQLLGDGHFAALLKLKDANDVHVALAASDWARSIDQEVLLVTDNLKDFPAALLEPFGVTALHPGDLLQVAYWASPKKVSDSLKKTAADFENPAFTLPDLLRSLANPQQFDNAELAAQLAVTWGLTNESDVKGGRKA